MPEFHLDTAGGVGAAPGSGLAGVIHFHDDLDAFTQGYIEALFFTESGDADDGKEIGDAGFSDLAPETLARIIADCREFQVADNSGQALFDAYESDAPRAGPRAAGMDFWYTRNGHGCGFWDGDWPEPYASQLTDASKAFRSLDAYLGDDGKVYLS
jgi:hypothetical protein